MKQNSPCDFCPATKDVRKNYCTSTNDCETSKTAKRYALAKKVELLKEMCINCPYKGDKMSDKNVSAGATCIGFGSALAMVISYSHLHSIWWAFWHGVFSWFYVIYYLIFRPY